MRWQEFPARHPFIWSVGCMVLVSLPQWFQSVWSLFRTDAPYPVIKAWLEKQDMALPHFSPYWVTVPLGITMFLWLAVELRRNRTSNSHASKQFHTQGVVSASRADGRFIELREACRIAYERLREAKSIYAAAAERLGYAAENETRDEAILGWFANCIVAKTPIYGKHPPSTLRELVDRNEFKRGHVDSVDNLRYYYEKEPRYTELEIRESDLERVIEQLKDARIEEAPTKLDATQSNGAEDDFSEGFNKETFKKAPTRDAALLRLTQLRSLGVAIRNDASGLLFTSDLEAWNRRVIQWMNEVIETIKSVDVAESEWFATLDTVPAARVPIPNVQLGGAADRTMFTSVFRQHDYRLARLNDLLQKHGIGV